MPDLHPLLSSLATLLGGWLFRAFGWLAGIAWSLGLWLTGLWDGWVAAFVPPQYAAILLNPHYHQMPLFLLLVLFGLMFRAHLMRKRPMAARAGTANQHLRVRRQPWHRRLKIWWANFGKQPWYWKIGRHVASLAQTHGLVVGGSGSGKSTLVVQLILQPCISLTMWLMRKLGKWLRRSILIISFDRSDPIEEATNVLEDMGVDVERWRVRQANGWNFLDGDIEMIAEALPDGWSKSDGDTGFFRQLCSDSISAALHEQDDEGIERNFPDMIERMDRIMADDPEIPELARRTWVRRFRSLARVMGESIGNDFDLVSALRKPGTVVHLSSNSYTNPAITPLVGAMAITHAKLAAEQVSDVYLVLEEASFLKNRTAMMDDLANSMRARGWRIVYITQNPQNVGEALQVNFGVAVFMGLGPLATKARDWCADVVKGFPGAFKAAELVLGATIDTLEGYVLLRGRCHDVSIAPYITRPAEHRAAHGRPVTGAVDDVDAVPEGGPEESPSEEPQGDAVWEVIEIERDAPAGHSGGTGGPSGLRGWDGLALPMPAGSKPVPSYVQGETDARVRRRAIWEKLQGTWNVQACHVWGEKSRNREKYGKTSYANHSGWDTHFLFWAWKVIEDHACGRAGDLERFYVENPAWGEFEWPERLNGDDDEYVILRALKLWMANPNRVAKPKKNETLSVDHACPGSPNTLCSNHRHLKLVTWAKNSELRWARAKGEYRDGMPGWEEAVV